jgi:tetratricopeptide (TPR) repeat protein
MRQTQKTPAILVRFCAAFAIAVALCACDGGGAQDASASTKQIKLSVVADKPLADFQAELLDFAFETATAIPTNPHIKDRSKAQETVVAACLELEQPNRALGYIERIENWRRGSCYADLAFYNARHGFTDQVQSWLDLAAQIADTTEDWRRDTIRVKIAQTHVLLGHPEKAAQFVTDVVESEQGKLADVEAMLGDETSFDDKIADLDAMIATGSFDIIKNALNSYAQLFDRFYADPQRRTRAEEKIRSSWNPLPIFIRFELLLKLANFANENGDQTKALALVDEAQTFLDDYEWPAEHRIPLMARLAETRFRTGARQQARDQADAALAWFEKDRETIVNIYRAETLEPLGRAYHAMGDTAKALFVYKKAVEESIVNRNSRPRAEDLSATCVSMALCAVQPDPELRERILGIRRGLGQPW